MYFYGKKNIQDQIRHNYLSATTSAGDGVVSGSRELILQNLSILFFDKDFFDCQLIKDMSPIEFSKENELFMH